MSFSMPVLFGLDLNAGDNDAILERDAECEPGWFEDSPKFNLGVVLHRVKER